MWSGSVATIPAGWALCDGVARTALDGTPITPPDLRSRFIVGAGSTYVPSATGGSASVNLAHSHTSPPHVHGFAGTTGDDNHQTGAASGSGNTVAETPHQHAFSGSTVATAATTDTQLSPGQSVLPPYYALAYIMKL